MSSAQGITGRPALWVPQTRSQTGDLLVRVVVIAERRRYNHTDYLITPVAGHGSRWVTAATCTLTTEVTP